MMMILGATDHAEIGAPTTLGSVLCHCPTPVSYTHLDVYKRQVSSNAFDGSERICCPSLFKQFATTVARVRAHSVRTKSTYVLIVFSNHDTTYVTNKSLHCVVLCILNKYYTQGGTDHTVQNYINIPPVSYTHLDVYKRQWPERNVAGDEM